MAWLSGIIATVSEMIWKNKSNISVPDYINEEFFIKALEEGLRELQIGIDEITISWGSNPGDNYCSSIYRMAIKYNTLANDDSLGSQRISLIVKTIPITNETKFLNDVGVFIKERVMYSDVLPCLNVLIGGDKFGAHCFYATKTPVQTIVFNDLTTDGFTMASRQNGLDWNHSVLILQQLGKFHATSMVLAERNPTIVKKLQKGMLCEETVLYSDTYFQMFGADLEQLIKISKLWPGYEDVREKLQRYYDNFNRITYKLAKEKEGDRIVVLNHGDTWINNFMFAYQDDTNPNIPTKSIFIDFQFSFYGSPACDLNFFLNTSVPLDVLRNRRKDLIECYYRSFSECLEFLRYSPVPSMEDLQYELRSRELYGLFALFGFMPMVTMPKELLSDTSIEAFTNEEYKAKKLDAIFSRDALQEHFRYSLKRLNELGVLDEF